MPVSAIIDQGKFRGRNDDGDETTATWKAAANTDWSQNVDENFRVRFLLSETAGGNPDDTCKIQYNLASAGWVDVSASSSVVRSFASPNVADNAATTEQMAGTGTFESGAFDEVDGGVSKTWSASRDTEHEFCMQIRSADVTNGQTLQLRCVRGGGTVYDTYTNTPTITVVEGGAPANLRRYTLTTLGIG